MERENFERHERLKTPKIKWITFVIPTYNEEENVDLLIDNLNSLKIPDGLQLRVVVSDNGSLDKTENMVNRRAADVNYIEFIHDSIPKSIGSARKVGVEKAVEKFYKENQEADTREHVIVNFDADSRIPSADFLVAAAEIFANPNIMVAHGPIEWISRDGDIDKKYKHIQHLLGNVRLKRLFGLYGRKLSHYINKPRDVFAGACTLVRESALIKFGEIELNFQHLDRIGEDIRFSLELQKRFSASQIVKDRRLLIQTSARGIETSSGSISVVKGISRLMSVLLLGEHVPESSKLYRNNKNLPSDNETQNLSEVEFNLSLFDVVGDFIDEADQHTYQLRPGEYVIGTRKMRKKRYWERKNNGDNLRPAVFATNGKIIPGYYALIGNKGDF